MKGHAVWKNDQQREFVKTFQSISGSHSAWTVWRDFVLLLATALSTTAELNQGILDERIARCMEVTQSYSQVDLERFVRLSTITTEALNCNPEQDFLGELYMGLDFGSSWHGQYFTPWHVAHMMAEMTLAGCEETVMANGYASVLDPTCGSGCMLIAAASAYKRDAKEREYQSDILFVGQDLDPTVALMCYIQLSILGCAGYVVIGNSLTNPVHGYNLAPQIDDGGEIWYTPMFNSPLWMFRRLLTFCAHEDQIILPHETDAEAEKATVHGSAELQE